MYIGKSTTAHSIEATNNKAKTRGMMICGEVSDDLAKETLKAWSGQSPQG
jgi:hypothetical protein